MLALLADKTFMCIAVLDGVLASISIKLRLRSELDAKTENSASPVHEKCHSPFENQCSLTPLALMSSARCGLGTAVLGDRLVALGEHLTQKCRLKDM